MHHITYKAKPEKCQLYTDMDTNTYTYICGLINNDSAVVGIDTHHSLLLAALPPRKRKPHRKIEEFYVKIFVIRRRKTIRVGQSVGLSDSQPAIDQPNGTKLAAFLL